ncbi:hypothetical protein [Chitinophaga japonensis]|nr:hypothetical protein [Chitinophaga japonensis]
MKWLYCWLIFSLWQAAGFFPDSSHLQTPAAAADKQAHITTGIFDDSALSKLLVKLQTDEAGMNVKKIFRNTPKKRKQRLYISAAIQQFNCSPRILYQYEKPDYCIQIKETKAGEYQWQDAFLPAYYNFLFRFTLF